MHAPDYAISHDLFGYGLEVKSSSGKIVLGLRFPSVQVFIKVSTQPDFWKIFSLGRVFEIVSTRPDTHHQWGLYLYTNIESDRRWHKCVRPQKLRGLKRKFYLIPQKSIITNGDLYMYISRLSTWAMDLFITLFHRAQGWYVHSFCKYMHYMPCTYVYI